jgi:hypothetical protein
MGFTSTRDYVDSIEAGESTFFSWRKAPTGVRSGYWNDLSLGVGEPPAQYYASAPLVSATIQPRGMVAGGAVSPQTRHLKSFMVMAAAATGLPAQVMLLDYLLYYPFVDLSSTDVQEMNAGVDNPVTLPRYTDGAGVRIMPVVTGAGITFGTTITITYTNELGVSGRTSTVLQDSGAAPTVLGQVAAGGRQNFCSQPFMPLEGSDNGVRSIESFSISGGGAGMVSLVLVRPLANVMLLEQTAPTEVDFMLDFTSLPRIEDGAHLNLAAWYTAANSTPLHGHIETVWS